MHSLSLRDILTLYRYRSRFVSLDFSLALTRGNPFSPSSILMHLDSSHERFTGVSILPKGSPVLFGQMICRSSSYQARLAFLTPEENVFSPALSSLVEVFLKQAGEWGAFHLTAEMEERSEVFQALRKVGFSVYARQRIWRLAKTAPAATVQKSGWELSRSGDELHIRALYDALVPALVQQVESFSTPNGQGMVYRQKGEVLAFVDGTFGPNGILLQPLVHPEVENVGRLLNQLPACFEPLFGRPVYIAVRSYQAWLEAPLEDMDAAPSPRLALLVRHLANIQRLQFLEKRLPVLDNPQAETGTPAFQHFIHDN